MCNRSKCGNYVDIGLNELCIQSVSTSPLRLQQMLAFPEAILIKSMKIEERCGRWLNLNEWSLNNNGCNGFKNS